MLLSFTLSARHIGHTQNCNLRAEEVHQPEMRNLPNIKLPATLVGLSEIVIFVGNFLLLGKVR